MNKRASILATGLIVAFVVFTLHAMAGAAEGTYAALLPHPFKSPIVPPATVSGTVFDDLNGDGVKDIGENGIPDVTVELLQDGGVIAAATTDGNGGYSLTTGVTGDYTVRESDPPGYASTTPNEVTVSLTTPGQEETVDFGDRGIGSIQGVVFDDRNGDGERDEGEPGIGGVTVTLFQESSPVETTATAGDGSYAFASLWLGDYAVEESDPPGYVSTTPNEATVSLTTPGQEETAHFGDRGIGAIEGVAFNDLDGDGDRDAGEPGIGGVEIVLTGADTGRIIATASDGSYEFTAVLLGEYTVWEADPSGFTSTTPNEVDILLDRPGQVETVNFGDGGLPGEIQGTVFNDLNGNGGQDAGEPGIGGVNVQLKSAGIEVRALQTLADGSYSFDVPAGGYTVEETDPPGYTSTTANVVSVSLPPAGTVTANFGDQFQGRVSGVAFNDANGNGSKDAGESTVGGVEIWLDGMISTTTSGDGAYSFSDVPEGSHTVAAAVPVGFVHTTPGEVLVSVAPGGSGCAHFGFQRQGTVGGVVFEDLNGDGVQEAAEDGIGNVTLELWQDGTRIATTATGGDGAYEFTDVNAGNYTVQEKDPAGTFSTTPNEVAVSVATGGSATANFGDQRTGTISGAAFSDLNGSGVQDAGGNGIVGVVVKLLQEGSLIEATTTDGDGAYCFIGVTAGRYTVEATRPAGFINTTPREVIVSVASGGSGSANFGFQQVGTIGGVVFDDANGNGVKDAGELGIGGVVATYDGIAVTTAGDGFYLFSGVAAGNHIVWTADVPGFVHTTPGLVAVPLAPGGSATANFGFMARGQVSGQCFQDLDGDGEQDAGEPGVVCTATLASEPRTTLSNPNGFFYFGDVESGAHTLSTILPAGFAHWSAPEQALFVAPGGSASGDASSQREGTLSGRVFHDANGDGSHNPGESGLGGVVISLAGNEVAITTTSGDGIYAFDDVPPGLYTVWETDPQGYTSSTPNEALVYVPPDGGATLNFGDQATGTIGGRVFNDLNGDGVKGNGEPGIGGVLVTLRTDAGALVKTTTTAGNGAFLFIQAGEGDFIVEAADPEGFASTTSNEREISLSAEERSASANFGDRLSGSVSGVVFRDTNGDGVQYAGEEGIAGAVVNLTLESMDVLTTATASDGSYLFTGVPSGSHTVEEEEPEGFASTTPNAVIVSLCGEDSASANFGDLPVGTVSGLVFNDVNGNRQRERGESGIGGVTIALSTEEGVLIAARKTVGDGTCAFSGVDAGEYCLEETNPEGFSSTTPDRVCFTVPEGGSAIANFGDQVEYSIYLPRVMRNNDLRQSS